MGLARARRHPVGRAGVRARRRAVALRTVPGGVLRTDDVRALGGRDARGAGRIGRDTAGVADRSDGDDRDTRHRPVDEGRRADRQALRGAGRGLSATSRATQGRCRGGDQISDEELVADRAREHDRRGAEQRGRVVGEGRRRPSASRRDGRGTRRQRAARRPASDGVSRADHGPAARVTLSARQLRGQRIQRSARPRGADGDGNRGVGDPLLRIVSAAGEIVAEHRRAPRGAGQTIRTSEHARQLETAVLAAFTTEQACRRKPNLPPGENALSRARAVRGLPAEQTAVVVSLADYAALAQVAR